MKKKIVALAVILLGVAALAWSAPTVEPGILFGMNLSKLSGQVFGMDWKAKSGFTVGAVLTFSLADLFAIQPGIFYGQKGGIHEEPYEEGKLRAAMRLSYFDFPVVARLSLPLGAEAKFRPYILGGIGASLKMGAKLRTEYIDEYELENLIDESTVKGLKAFGTFLVFGAGFNYMISDYRLVFEVRSSRSLSTISSEGLDLKLGVLAILIGVSFR